MDILKNNGKFFDEKISLQFNYAISVSKFPGPFRFAKITPAFKNGSRHQKGNDSPVGILPIVTKKFEKLICRHFSNHFVNILLKFQCGFSKGFGTQ